MAATGRHFPSLRTIRGETRVRGNVLKLLLAALVLALTISCAAQTPEPPSLTVATWNLQAFFDDIDDGDEYSGYRRSDGWSQSKYQARLESVRSVVKSSLAPDILFVQEVESAKALSDLLDSSMRRRGYTFYSVAQEDSPISVGFISRLEPTSVTLHRAGEQRTVLRAEFYVGGEVWAFYALHAKSNLGDGEENRAARKETAALVNSLLAAEAPGVNVACLGDFNTEPRGDSLDMLCVAGRRGEDEIVQELSIPLSSSPGRVGELGFYDPLLDNSVPPGGEGTYWYDGSFHDYDRVLFDNDLALRSGGFRLEIVEAGAVNGSWPNPYDPETGEGLSDHFPVKATFFLSPS